MDSFIAKTLYKLLFVHIVYASLLQCMISQTLKIRISMPIFYPNDIRMWWILLHIAKTSLPCKLLFAYRLCVAVHDLTNVKNSRWHVELLFEGVDSLYSLFVSTIVV